MKQFKISQSLIKDWQDFKDEQLCGSVFQAKYITNTWLRTWNDSPLKALGRYFEFILTGAMPTGYHDYPKPNYLKTALTKKAKNPDYKFTVDDMMSEYRLAHKNAERTIKLLEASGIKIQSAQVFREKGALTGNIDIEAIFLESGKEINIDIKYSGLIYDKWNKFGWSWRPEQMAYHGIQAKQYSILNGRPTYFLVVSNTNDKDIKFFHAYIDPFYLEQHEKMALSLIEKLNFVNDIGWQNYPELNKCESCPLKNSCSDRVTTLIAERIEIIDE